MVRRVFHGDQDYCRLLAFQLPTRLQTRLGPASPGLVDFYFCPRRLTCQIVHRLPEFVQHHPRRFVTTQRKQAQQQLG